MDDELRRIRKEAVMVYPKYYLGIYLKRLRKIMLNVIQDSRYASRSSTRTPSKYELREMPLGASYVI
jgi:hypothetical protein